MGSFNFVCGVSAQVITEGSRCRLVVLLQGAGYNPLVVRRPDGAEVTVNQVSNTATGAASYWQPQSLFLEAKYEEYGRFALAHTAYNVLALLALLRAIPYPLTTSAGDHHRDAPFDLKAFVKSDCPKFAAACARYSDDLDIDGLIPEIDTLWSYLNDAVPQNRAFAWSHISRQDRQLALYVVHEQAFTGLVDFTKGVVDYGDFSFEPTAFVQRMLEHAEEVLASQTKRHEQAADPEKIASIISFHRQDALFEGLTLAARLDSMELSTMRRIAQEGLLLAAFTPDLSLEERVEKLWPMLETVYALVAMGHMNLTFTPHRTCVSDDGVTPGTRYAEFVAKVSAEVSKADEERMYGPYRAFHAVFDSHDEVLGLVELAPSLDIAIRDVKVLAAEAEFVRIQFHLTAELDDVRELFKHHGYARAAQTAQQVD